MYCTGMGACAALVLKSVEAAADRVLMADVVRASHLAQVPCHECSSTARTFECVCCKRRFCKDHITENERYEDRCAVCSSGVEHDH